MIEKFLFFKVFEISGLQKCCKRVILPVEVFGVSGYIFSNISYGPATGSIQNDIRPVTKSVKFTKITYSEIEQNGYFSRTNTTNLPKKTFKWKRFRHVGKNI